MKTEKPFIIANGGNSVHIPGHTKEACLSAYTAGADGLLLTTQMTSDGHLVLYEHADLSTSTNGKGRISDTSLDKLMSLDAGASFGPGRDKPWSRNNSLFRHIVVGLLDTLLLQLEDNVTYLLRPGLGVFDTDKRITIAHKILKEFSDSGRVAPVLVADTEGFLHELNSHVPAGTNVALFSEPDTITLSTVNKSRKENLKVIVTNDVTKASETLGLLVTSLTENWPGTNFDRNRWVAGISSGHHIMRPMIGIEEYNEPVFCASATVSDGLKISVVEGKTYASAGVVSRFSLGSSFVGDVDFTYDNPQIANMMVMAVINQEVFDSYYHQPGIVENPNAMFQNHAFDTHGAAPFVSMEREEADGFRIMKYTSTAGVYEWYGNYYLGDVGSGSARKGKLRLERRGRFFSGYYQDENNDDWIGDGTLENASMNARVYLRLAAKHYLKRGAPDPLLSLNVTYNNLIIRRPHGAVYQPGVSTAPYILSHK